jgi:hypothetical protein
MILVRLLSYLVLISLGKEIFEEFLDKNRELHESLEVWLREFQIEVDNAQETSSASVSFQTSNDSISSNTDVSQNTSISSSENTIEEEDDVSEQFELEEDVKSDFVVVELPILPSEIGSPKDLMLGNKFIIRRNQITNALATWKRKLKLYIGGPKGIINRVDYLQLPVLERAPSLTYWHAFSLPKANQYCIWYYVLLILY